MEMKFKYKRFSQGVFAPVLRPVIPIGISYKGQTEREEVLVDSGADLCLFDAEIGELIGVPVSEGEVGKLFGVTSESTSPQPYYRHPITINVGGWDLEIEAGFVPHYKPAHGIVGQIGFFDRFVVKFDYQKEMISLTPKAR
jgi:hypothetical protein